MPSLLFTLFLGFLLGLKHAFEPDHVIAVSTITAEQKNPLKAVLVGTFWGLGHTTTLFIIGIIVLLLRVSIPEKLSLSLEGLVGLMLIILGLRVLRQNESLHSHKHQHDKKEHQHYHLAGKKGYHRHHISFMVGLIHGIAGSGALMLLVLSTITSLLEGLYYILIFGLGSSLGMSLMSFIIGVPFIYTKNKLPKLENYLKIGAGVLSVIFGVIVSYEVISSFF